MPLVNIIIASLFNSVNHFVNLDYQRFVIHSCSIAVNGNSGYVGNPQHKDTAATTVESANHPLKRVLPFTFWVSLPLPLRPLTPLRVVIRVDVVVGPWGYRG